MMPTASHKHKQIFLAPKHIVLLSDGIRGHRHQSLGIAQWLERLCGASITELPIPKLSGIKRYLSLKLGARHLPKASPEEAYAWLQNSGFPADSLTLPQGSLCISAGSSAAPFSLALSRALRGYSAVVMTPSLGTRPFDFAIIPEHDHPRSAPNLLTTLGAPNHIYRPALHEAGQKLLQTLSPLPQRVLALLIGGSDANYRIDPAWAEQTLRPLLEAVEQNQAFKTALLVTTSRRTGKETDEVIESILRPRPATRFLLLASRDAGNPLPALLGLATHVLCTDDSVSMVSEAVTAGFRVGLLRAFRRNSPSAWIKTALGAGTSRFDAFFAALANRDILIDLGKAPESKTFLAFLGKETQCSGTPLNEAKRAAEWILEKWKTTPSTMKERNPR